MVASQEGDRCQQTKLGASAIHVFCMEPLLWLCIDSYDAYVGAAVLNHREHMKFVVGCYLLVSSKVQECGCRDVGGSLRIEWPFRLQRCHSLNVSLQRWGHSASQHDKCLVCSVSYIWDIACEK